MLETPSQPGLAGFPRSSLLLFIFAASLLGVIAGGALVYFLVPSRSPAQNIAPPPQPAVVNLDINTDVTDAVEKVGPAVVTILNHLPPQRTFFGTRVEPTASGSGVIISRDGYIVTNNHVVEGAQLLEVITADGTTLSAKLIGVDAYADLAVLKADGTLPVVAQWGNSDTLKPGETVIAIGSPLGDFTNTVTVGVVSATERAIEIEKNYFLEGLIQTDAAINQGNSGGPLVNLAGQVVGINTLIVRGGSGSAVAEGLGFAIPSSTAKAVAEQLIEKGYFARPYLGVRWVANSEQLAARYNLPTSDGIILTQIANGGPAEKAGLERGDILVAVGGQKIDSDHPFRNLLFHFAPGDAISFELYRGDERKEIKVALGEMPA